MVSIFPAVFKRISGNRQKLQLNSNMNYTYTVFVLYDNVTDYWRVKSGSNFSVCFPQRFHKFSCSFLQNLFNLVSQFSNIHANFMKFTKYNVSKFPAVQMTTFRAVKILNIVKNILSIVAQVAVLNSFVSHKLQAQKRRKKSNKFYWYFLQFLKDK